MVTPIRHWQTLRRTLIVLVVCFIHQSGFALPTYEKVAPLFNNGSLAIYPESRHPRSNARDWCGSRKYSDAPAKFEIVYDVPHAKRDALFPQGYEAFVDTAVRSVVAQHCDNNPANVSLYFYRRGEMRYLDVIRFRLRDKNGSSSVSRTSESINREHPSSKRLVAQQELGRCSGRPFCDLSGGIYLNAIYENNEALIRKLDKQIMAETLGSDSAKGVQDFVAALSGHFSKDNSQVDPFNELRDSSILKTLATQYMDEYGVNHYRSASGACLQQDSVTITRQYTTPVIRYENQLGIDQGSVGGDTFSATYTINKEFKSLCNKICSHLGVGGSYLSEALSLKSGLVSAGISQIRTQRDCNSPEVKQFERHLIALTDRSLNRKATPSAPAPTKLSDVEQAKKTKQLFMEAMEQGQLQSEASAVEKTRQHRPRTGSRQAKSNVSRHGGTSRMTRSAAVNRSAMHDYPGNLKAGEEFLAANKHKDGVIETSSGLQYRMIKDGKGSAPKSGDQVTAHMRLTLIDGRVIHDTYAEGKPSTFAPYQSIKGFNEGLKLLTAGGKIRLFIPAALAYGNRAAGGIPAGAMLIYDVELLRIH